MAAMNETDTPRLLGNVSLLHVPPLVTSSYIFFSLDSALPAGVLRRRKKFEMNTSLISETNSVQKSIKLFFQEYT